MSSSLPLPQPGRLSAVDVAKCVLRLSAQERQPVDPRQLQNLLYYVQGWSLAIRDRPAFSARLEAWEQGPVVPEVWHFFSRKKDTPIPTSDIVCTLTKEEIEFITSVWNEYKGYRGDALGDMTQREPPWKNAYKPDKQGRCQGLLSDEAIKKCFRERCGTRSHSELLLLARRNPPPESAGDERLDVPSN